MQAHGARLLARGAARSSVRPAPIAAAASHRVRHASQNSFIRQVMDQVKKDMEQDEKGKKDWEKVQQSSEAFSKRAGTGAEKMTDWSERAGSAFSSASEKLKEAKEAMAKRQQEFSAKADQMTEGSETLKQAREMAEKASGVASDKGGSLFAGTRQAFNKVMDRTSSSLGALEEEKAEKLKEWRANRASLAAQQEREEEKKQAADEAAGVAKEEGKEEVRQEPASAESAVVVSDAGNSSWDRFGTRMKDMPFLNAVFENPFFDRMFGESEIAASIREMKDMDPSFFLEEFYEEIEHVVAPHIVTSFLEGDAESLEKHCGEAAFAAVNASIKARKKQRLELDPNILAGPREIELKGAKLMDKGAPMFIWTFNTQQINCLRDRNGEVVEGAVDDIRTVHYAMVVQRHPELENLDLEYPWIISELAIIGNQPSF